jgi:CRISPR-associated protein Csd1
MGWLSELNIVYDRIQENDKIEDKPLPLYHIKNNAPLVITLDGKGNFRSAKLLGNDEKSNWQTCMPCTEKSAARTSGVEPYPFCDKIEYVAGDYAEYADGKNLKEKHNEYMTLLEKWAQSEYSNEKIKSVYSYVKKKTLIKDILNKGHIPEIDSGKKIGENNVFVRWVVEIPWDAQRQTWEDSEIQQLWVDFYARNCPNSEGFCYISGKKPVKLRELHPQKIRNAGDGAKLISSNDNSNYTFRGRFTNAGEACQIGMEVTEKAHNALRWLIAKQGAVIGNGLTVVSWCSASDVKPQLLKSSHDLWDDEDDEKYDPATITANKIKNRLRGYYQKIPDDDKIIIMGLNAATPGRMSVLLYREFIKSDFCEAQENWYTHITWFYTYWEKGKKEAIHTISSPSPEEIAKAAFEEHLRDDIKAMTIQRLLPCIIDKSPIPSDIEQLCFSRASRLNMLDSNTERTKTLETACAVIRYNLFIRNKENYNVGLEEDRTSRDYLYGRLLAVADKIETEILAARGETRESNAVRYMQRFAKYPCSTWKLLYAEKLQPYMKQLDPKFRNWYEGIVQNISDKFEHDDFVSDKALSGEFLLGYHCQQKDFWRKHEKNQSENNKLEEN